VAATPALWVRFAAPPPGGGAHPPVTRTTKSNEMDAMHSEVKGQLPLLLGDRVLIANATLKCPHPKKKSPLNQEIRL